MSEGHCIKHKVFLAPNENECPYCTIAALQAEVESLTDGLKKANAGFEEYERKYYLTLDRAEAAEKGMDELRGKIDKVKNWKADYGGLRTEYIEWNELDEILGEPLPTTGEEP